MFIIFYHLCTWSLGFTGFRVLNVLDSMDYVHLQSHFCTEAEGGGARLRMLMRLVRGQVSRPESGFTCSVDTNSLRFVSPKLGLKK